MYRSIRQMFLVHQTIINTDYPSTNSNQTCQQHLSERALFAIHFTVCGPKEKDEEEELDISLAGLKQGLKQQKSKASQASSGGKKGKN